MRAPKKHTPPYRDTANERTPILHHHNRVHTRGSGSSESIEGEEVTRSWLEKRLCILFACGILLLILVLVLLGLVVMLVIKLKQAGAGTELAMATAQRELIDFKSSVQGPIMKLNTLSAQLENSPFIPKLPQATPPEKPAVPPVNATVWFPSEVKKLAPGSKPRYHWSGCDKKCERRKFESTPLVILSFDGFAAKYLDKNIVKSLEKMAECGVRAKKVYPSFPSKSFPNHYTMVTGLWPESHGVVDNEVYDPKISPKVENMKTTSYGQFFGGEPIWSIYRRKTGRKANCFMFPGCAFNNTGHAPNYAPPYDKTVPLRYRLDTIIDWLKEDQPPGLITAYYSEPDNAGHYRTTEDDIDNILHNLDSELDRFFGRLYDEHLLNCINLVIFSDHGMEELTERIYLKDHIHQNDVIPLSGVVGKIYLNGTETSLENLQTTFTCKPNLKLKANTRKSMPIRKHFSRQSRVGDLILEGPPGTTFYVNRESEFRINGDHGYDYLYLNMHTVFFARGPDFKQNYELEPFQNVQYMNLWLDLLNLEGQVETNGTVGFFDQILVNPRKREEKLNAVRECSVGGLPGALDCSGCTAHELSQISMKIALCIFHNPPIPISSKNYCSQPFCDTVVLENNSNRFALIEPLASDPPELFDNCTYSMRKFEGACQSLNGTQFSISFRNTSILTAQSGLLFPAPESYAKIHQIVQKATHDYLEQFGSLYTVSGVTVDANFDGVADDVAAADASTHFYRILFACTSNWVNLAAIQCAKGDLKALAFIFPLEHIGSMECMSDPDILLEYSATIHDVARIAGFEFRIASLTVQENIQLIRNITTQLW